MDILHKLSPGFSLVEVLTAMALLAIGLLGIASLQLVALRSNHSAYLESIANQQLLSMAERIRANHGQQLSTEIALWNADNQALLPQGQGEVSFHNQQFLLILTWHWRDQQTLAPACVGLNRSNLACLSLTIQV